MSGGMGTKGGAFKVPKLRVAICVLLALVMSLLAAAALIEFRDSGLARRTFVFYAIDSGEIILEQRMLRRSGTLEGDIARYVEEALLGPFTPDVLPVLPRGSRLRSLLYRDGVVYADLFGDPVLSPPDWNDVFRGFGTLSAGVKRNFSSVGGVRFFIDGRPAFAGEFR